VHTPQPEFFALEMFVPDQVIVCGQNQEIADAWFETLVNLPDAKELALQSLSAGHDRGLASQAPG
jgi:hypothetical protein